MPENFDRNNLLLGSGETVSILVNDLTNRELIRQKYTFKPPARRDLVDREDFADNEDEEIVLGSMIMGPDAPQKIQK